MAAVDIYATGALQKNAAIQSPANMAFAITPHDTNEFSYVTRGVYVGTAGDVAAILVDDSVAVTFVAVPAGTLLPIRAKIIKSTDTTADNLVGLV